MTKYLNIEPIHKLKCELILQTIKMVISVKMNCIVIILSIFINFEIFGQSNLLFDKGYQIENYSSKEGVPKWMVHDVIQDGNGYLWMTNLEYLLKYDGYKFTKFKPNKDILNSQGQLNHLSNIAEDNYGNIWATIAGGLLRFDPKKELFVKVKLSQIEAPLIAYLANFNPIKKDKHGNLWTSSNSGLLKITPTEDSCLIQNWGFPTISSTALSLIESIIESDKNNLLRLVEVGNNFHLKRRFEIKNDVQNILIVHLGEYFVKALDHGWIEDSKGEVIWKPEKKENLYAGGSSYDAIQVDTINLKKGIYYLNYSSDEYHSFAEWNGYSVKKPEWWGIQLLIPNRQTIENLFQLLIDKSKNNLPLHSFQAFPFIDKEGQPYYMTSEQIYKITEDSTTIFKEVADVEEYGFDYIATTETGNSGKIWFSGLKYISNNEVDQGLSFFDPLTSEVKQINLGIPAPSNPYLPITSLNEDKSGTLWVGHNLVGLYRLNPPFFELGNNLIETNLEYINIYATGHNDQNYGMIHSFWVDGFNNLWIGTENKGLFKIQIKNSFIDHIDFTDYIRMDWFGGFRALFKDSENSLWASFGDGQIIQIREDGLISHFEEEFGGIKLKDPSAMNYKSALVIFYEDDDKNLWCGGINKIIRYNRKTRAKKEFMLPGKESKHAIWAIEEDVNGNMWIVNGSSILFFDKKSENIKLVYGSGTESEWPYILKHNNRGMWLYRGYGDFLHLDYKNDKTEIIYQNRINETPLLGIAQDQNGNLWIASSSGLYFIDVGKDSIFQYTEDHGLENTMIWSLNIDSKHNVWVNTSQGIYRFDQQEKRFKSFRQLQNLIAPEFKSNNPFIVDEEGYLILGDETGILKFHPDCLVENIFPPKVLITHLNKSGKKLGILNKPIEEPILYHQNDLSLHYIGIGFDEAMKQNYSYKLEGVDDNWVDAKRERIARYPNLSPGSYTFHVKAANADGIWSEPTSLSFTISPPWWLTWWAKVIYGLAFIGALVLIYRWRTQKQRKELEATRRRNENLQQIDRLKDQFLANTSHELRTPLNGIIGIAESMIDGATGALPKKSIWNLGLITSSGKRLANLINDILDFSKLRTKQLVLQKMPVDIHSAAEVVLELSKPFVKQKELDLVNDVPSDLELAEADENRLQQILHNLVGNAVKFTEEGMVRISAERQNGHIKIDVSDTGIGIPEDKFDTIFHSFEQADGSTAREYGGTGLGLTVTKQLVELHGGTIDVKSKIGEGSTFSFTLPTSKVDRKEYSPKVGEQKVGTTDKATEIVESKSPLIPLEKGDSPAHGAPREGSPPLKGVPKAGDVPITSGRTTQYRILIVDDEPINLQVLENHLSMHNYDIVKANSGPKALEIIHRTLEYSQSALRTAHSLNQAPGLAGETAKMEAEDSKPFDLIILDIMMPKMSGYEVCQKLSEMYPSSQLPVIMLTAKNRVTDLVEGFTSGANDYLTKPFSKDELLTRIRTHLKTANVTKAYGRFVPHHFLELLGKESIIDVQLGDQTRRLMTILFSDIRGYTTLSEKMTPEANFQFINRYLQKIGPAIEQNNGFINQFMGDGIMALFTKSPVDALQAAIDMQTKARELNAELMVEGKPIIHTGIGLHSGDLMLGILGDEHRNDTGVISDAVNTASRMEGLTKLFGASILLSEATLKIIPEPEQFTTRFLGKVQVKGKKKVVKVYECFEVDPDNIQQLKKDTMTNFSRALDFYFDKEFLEATSLFKKITEANPDDQSARLYLKKAAQNIVEGVSEDWTGVVRMEEK